MPREMPIMTTDECIASVWCPRCEAQPGELCHDTGRGWIVAHPERVAIARAWEERQGNREWLKGALRQITERRKRGGG
jgi:hypothetical protein